MSVSAWPACRWARHWASCCQTSSRSSLVSTLQLPSSTRRWPKSCRPCATGRLQLAARLARQLPLAGRPHRARRLLKRQPLRLRQRSSRKRTTWKLRRPVPRAQRRRYGYWPLRTKHASILCVENLTWRRLHEGLSARCGMLLQEQIPVLAPRLNVLPPVSNDKCTPRVFLHDL